LKAPQPDQRHPIGNDEPRSLENVVEMRIFPGFGNSVHTSNSDVLGTTAPAQQGAPATKPDDKSSAKLIRDFKTGISHKDLPFAAFPGLKIQGTTTASAGLAAKGFWGGFGASDRQVEELELGEVRKTVSECEPVHKG